VQDLPFNAERAMHLSKNARTSVSAEVFGKYFKKDTFKPTVIEKTESIKLK
jgi:hypothetical protein